MCTHAFVEGELHLLGVQGSLEDQGIQYYPKERKKFKKRNDLEYIKTNTN